MIYNLPRKRAKFEETWVLKESPNWRNFFNTFYTDGLDASVSIKFISNSTEFDSIDVSSS